MTTKNTKHRSSHPLDGVRSGLSSPSWSFGVLRVLRVHPPQQLDNRAASRLFPPMPRALITGITGQDGSYLAEFLLAKGYEVFGMVRRSSTENFERIEHLRDRLSSSRPTCSTSSR